MDFMPPDEAAAEASATGASGSSAAAPTSQPAQAQQTTAQPSNTTQATGSSTASDDGGEFMPPEPDATEDPTDTAAQPSQSEPPTTTPPVPSGPPTGPLTGYVSGMHGQAYRDWRANALAQGYTQQQIDNAVRQGVDPGAPASDTGGGNGGAQENVDANGNPIGVGLGNWKPGDVYTGTGTSSGDGLMTDQTFTGELPADAPTPTTWDVTPEQTVQGQMDRLTHNMQDNPLYQNIAASLERAQAAHGGANSLMAETAAYKGVVDMAFQIASADAATYARSAEFNASTANQFSLSNLQFMQQALLSTQNYQQAQVLQAQQIQGNLQSVSMQVAGQIKATTISANATVQAAGIGAQAQIDSANIQRQTALDSLQANFQNTWMLNEQQQGHSLEQMDRTTDNQIRHDIIASNTNFGQQLTLQMNTEQNANLRQLMAAVGTIGATPGLTGAQQQHAIEQITAMYHTNSNLTSSFYSSPGYSISSGQSGANISGQTTSAVQAAVANMPGGPTYQHYGDYLSYGQGGYTSVAPPTIPFFGGTGLPATQGGIPSYGSNLEYEHSTGNTVNYQNPLTGNNPIGNVPGTTGAGRGGATPPPFMPPGHR